VKQGESSLNTHDPTQALVESLDAANLDKLNRQPSLRDFEIERQDSTNSVLSDQPSPRATTPASVEISQSMFDVALLAKGEERGLRNSYPPKIVEVEAAPKSMADVVAMAQEEVKDR
jgi:hypothetical protein